jgi:hypothetical protein
VSFNSLSENAFLFASLIIVIAGSDQGDIIGTVINHGKKKYWIRGGNCHYHRGLQAGENTLEASLARLLIRTLAAGGKASDFRTAYITFMVCAIC